MTLRAWLQQQGIDPSAIPHLDAIEAQYAKMSAEQQEEFRSRLRQQMPDPDAEGVPGTSAAESFLKGYAQNFWQSAKQDVGDVGGALGDVGSFLEDYGKHFWQSATEDVGAARNVLQPPDDQDPAVSSLLDQATGKTPAPVGAAASAPGTPSAPGAYPGGVGMTASPVAWQRQIAAQVASDPSQLTPEEWAYLSTLLGTDAHAAYQGFSQNWSIAWRQTAGATTALTGGAPSGLEPGTPVGNQTVGIPSDLTAGIIEQPAMREPSATAVTPAQWRDYIYHSTGYLGQVVAQQAAESYALDPGVPMPADLRQQIVNAVNGMPDDAKANLVAQLEAGGGRLTKLPDTIAGEGGLMDTYGKAHPTAQQQTDTERARVDYAFQGALGRKATDAEFAATKDMDTTSLDEYVKNLPSSVGGLNYGRLTYLHGAWDGPWQDAFGHAPSASDIQWMATKTRDQIQSHLDDSPSPIAGYNVKAYKQLSDFTDKLEVDLNRYHGGRDLFEQAAPELSK